MHFMTKYTPKWKKSFCFCSQEIDIFTNTHKRRDPHQGVPYKANSPEGKYGYTSATALGKTA